MKEPMLRLRDYIQVVFLLSLVSCYDSNVVPPLHFDTSKRTISGGASMLTETLKKHDIYTNRLFSSMEEVTSFLKRFGNFNFKTLESMENTDSNYHNVLLRTANYEIQVGYWKYHKKFTVDYIHFLDLKQEMFNGISLDRDLGTFENHFGKGDVNSYDDHLRYYYSADHQTISIQLNELNKIKSLSLSTFFIDD